MRSMQIEQYRKETMASLVVLGGANHALWVVNCP